LGESKLTNKLWAIVSLELLTLETLKEGYSWSFGSWIFEVLGEIILEIVMMSMLAIWGAEQWDQWNLA